MNNFIIIIILFFLTLNTVAQTYTPMLELGKVWNIHHFDSYLPNNNYDFNITLDHTTTINGTEYFHASNGMLFNEDILNKKKS